VSLKAVIRRLRYGIVGRLFISHVLVAVLTALTFVLVLTVVLLLAVNTQGFIQDEFYQAYAETVVLEWQVGADSQLAASAKEENDFAAPENGYGLIVREGVVVFRSGAAPCAIGERVAVCAPEWQDPAAVQAQGRALTVGGMSWVDVALPLTTGGWALARGPQPSLVAALGQLDDMLFDLLQGVALLLVLVALFAAPASAVLVWLLAHRLLRRFARFAETSRRFAAGDLTARVRDARPDEVGELAQGFDAMADALGQTVYALRELSRANAALATQAERAAVQSERLRLARDLHDDLAQRLFSLATTAAALPDVIAHDSPAGAQRARQLAELAESTLVGLRALLVDLRPNGVLEQGLAASLRALCAEWAARSGITPEVSIALANERFPLAVQRAVYHIAQESLHNIARHAGARSVTVSLVEGRQHLTLSISDDGSGLLPEREPAAHGHFGLIGMRERAEALGGTLVVECETAHGTTVRATLPVSEPV
jgi:signal transduction histidine kinase